MLYQGILCIPVLYLGSRRIRTSLWPLKETLNKQKPDLTREVVSSNQLVAERVLGGAIACTCLLLFLRQPHKAAVGSWAIQIVDATVTSIVYRFSKKPQNFCISLICPFFSMLSADKRFRYIMVQFLLKIGDSVKKQSFLPSSGRGSGQRISELGGRRSVQALCNSTLCILHPAGHRTAVS